MAGFALISGAGLAIDFTAFWLLSNTLRAGLANAISASAAVTFVYFVSTAQVFRYRDRLLLPLFAAYCLYQVAAVAAASWAIDALVSLGWAPLVSKTVILPLTFSTNYAVMELITRARSRTADDAGDARHA